LVVDQRLAELAAIPNVLHRRSEGSLRDAQRDRRIAGDAVGGHQREQILHPARRENEVFRRHVSVLEHQLRHAGAAQTHQIQVFAYRQALGPLVDQDRAHALQAGRIADADEDDEHIGDLRRGAPELAPVDDVLVALENCLGLDVAEIRTGVGL